MTALIVAITLLLASGAFRFAAFTQYQKMEAKIAKFMKKTLKDDKLFSIPKVPSSMIVFGIMGKICGIGSAFSFIVFIVGLFL